MSHYHFLLAQALSQFCGVALPMASKNKISLRRQHFKPQLKQRSTELLATIDHRVAGLRKPIPVLKRGHGTNNRQTIQRIGIEAIFYPLQRFNQIRMTYRKTNPQPGQ